jgi:cell fate regulator YaaT (PSP1 superfamily)
MPDNRGTDMLYTRGCCYKRQPAKEAACYQVESCQKLATFDWLAGMHNAALPTDIVEVRFKNTRKAYFKNVNELPLRKGDVVAVEASPGHDIGIVSLTGDIVTLQMTRNGLQPDKYEYKKIYRKVKGSDVEKWSEAIALERRFMIRSRQLASILLLKMKIGDVEVQGDKTKAIFYYIADERVDFRELIKIMADELCVRVEMRQIGARQEAGRIGGISTCGRELCCAKWQCSFASVSTGAARHQDIAINQQKLAGQCGKLKCCLNYELSCYIDAQKDFPKSFDTLEVAEGTAFHHKTDIFKRTMWYNFDRNSVENLVAVPVDRVKEILEQNKRGITPDALLSERYSQAKGMLEETKFVSAAGEDSITRFDTAPRRHSHQRGKKYGKPQPQSEAGGQSHGKPEKPHNTGNHKQNQNTNSNAKQGKHAQPHHHHHRSKKQ